MSCGSNERDWFAECSTPDCKAPCYDTSNYCDKHVCLHPGCRLGASQASGDRQLCGVHYLDALLPSRPVQPEGLYKIEIRERSKCNVPGCNYYVFNPATGRCLAHTTEKTWPAKPQPTISIDQPDGNVPPGTKCTMPGCTRAPVQDGFCPEHHPMIQAAPRVPYDPVTFSLDQPDGNVPPGTKGDGGKLRWFLLMPWDALVGVMRVLEKGAKKYAPNNWRHVKPRERYLDAAIRHIVALHDGEELDPETGEHHIDHAICCLLFYRGIKEEKK